MSWKPMFKVYSAISQEPTKTVKEINNLYLRMSCKLMFKVYGAISLKATKSVKEINNLYFHMSCKHGIGWMLDNLNWYRQRFKWIFSK